jgi:beta-glucosidase
VILGKIPAMRVNFFCRLIVFGFAFLISTSFALRADEESCAACSRLVQATGQFDHRKAPEDAVIQGAPVGSEAAFREDISGPKFAITISGLPAGKYTVVIGEAETYLPQVGVRKFDVSIDGVTLVTNFDISGTAGGLNKVCYITGEVDHADDSVHGPLSIEFAVRDYNAKFNTIEVKDASGASVISLKAADLAFAFSEAAKKIPVVTTPEIWRDPSQLVDARVRDIISRMSLAEKIQQVRNGAPAIPRLGIPAYDYWNECLHGVARAGVATVFPQAIGMAATWDAPLIHDEADVIATEGRSKFNDYSSRHNGNVARFYGLTFWTPNINIFRDPRWGRGQETYGEDTFLTGTLGVAFIRGLQGDDTNYFKAMACAKHYAVHSGPEPERHRFNVDPSERDLYETYLPHFEMAAREGHVGGFMGAYNSVYGKPANASSFLLEDLLRKQWGFDGYIVSDCSAIRDIWQNHKYVPTPEQGAALAVKAGCDICCGSDYNALLKAVQTNLITEPEIDNALYYAMKARIQLGMFDPPERVPWSNIGTNQIDTPEHEALALKVARESIVLLKNGSYNASNVTARTANKLSPLLPLDRNKIKRIAVIGPNADSVPMLVGNYNGTPGRPVTILGGIKQIAGTNCEVVYAQGCPLALRKDGSDKQDPQLLADALAAANSSDVVIFASGINAQMEGEESKRADAFDGFVGGDRTKIELPQVQTDLLKALKETGKPIVLINCSGSAMAMPWEVENLPAIVQAWYSGEQGGRAVAEILFGNVNPAGRLPVTFYKSTADLPDFENYSMSNRTYRYFNGLPEFAFGHGLSYTKFNYSGVKLNAKKFTAGDTVKLSFALKNSGTRDGDEVAQIYFRHVNSSVQQPKLALCGFTRIHLAHGESKRVAVEIPVERFRFWDLTQHQYVVEQGNYELLIGSASDDIRLKEQFHVVTDTK